MLAELFDKVTSGDWLDAGGGVQYRIDDDVLFLKCSDSLEDWKKNLTFWPAFYNGAIVHKGFKKAYTQAKPVLDRLVFHSAVGYSFGGAVLTLLAKDKPYLPVITFGAPRVFLTPTKQRRHLRVRNYGDIITKLPPFYRHTGDEYITQGEAVRPDDVSEIEWITGHHPDEYRQRLKGA